MDEKTRKRLWDRYMGVQRGSHLADVSEEGLTGFESVALNQIGKMLISLHHILKQIMFNEELPEDVIPTIKECREKLQELFKNDKGGAPIG